MRRPLFSSTGERPESLGRSGWKWPDLGPCAAPAAWHRDSSSCVLVADPVSIFRQLGNRTACSTPESWSGGAKHVITDSEVGKPFNKYIKGWGKKDARPAASWKRRGVSGILQYCCADAKTVLKEENAGTGGKLMHCSPCDKKAFVSTNKLQTIKFQNTVNRLRTPYVRASSSTSAVQKN
jgi:hypothetical protein